MSTGSTTKTTQQETKQSKVERAKAASRFLRGTLAETLASDEPAFGADDVQVLKFHGIYQQDDRDVRKVRRALGQDKEHNFMIRAKIPGGRLTAGQYLALDRLAERVTWNRSLRVTTRQGLQLHGVIKGDLRETLRSLNTALVSTLAACGDVERNVMAPPAPRSDPAHRSVRALADEIAEELCPRTAAYHQIWLDGERIGPEPREDEEPLYGEQYLPRKFKTAIALPDDNSVDVRAHDVGLVAVIEDGAFRGLNVLVGGGLGMTHKKPDTFARLGTRLGFVERSHAVDLVRTVAAIFRDHGNRADRRHARLKYLIEEWGEKSFRDEVVSRADFEIHPWVETEPLRHRDHLGPHPQGDGRFYYGVFVENGRIADTPTRRTKTALAKAIATFGTDVIFTPSQDVLLADLEEDDVQTLEKVLDAYRVTVPRELPGVRRYAMACPALPTCGLALTESERVMPEAVDAVEDLLADHGLEDEPITVRMTGCPNGCARPYTADVGFVGRGLEKYDVYVGGGLDGDRLGDLWATEVPLAELAESIAPLVARWAAERRPEEPLGAYYHRTYRNGEAPGTLTGAKDLPVAAPV